MAKSKGKRKRRNDSLVLQLMVLVAIVLVVFEGKLVVTMVTHSTSTKKTESSGSGEEKEIAGSSKTETQQDAEAGNLASIQDGARGQSVLAGLPIGKGTVSQQSETDASYPTVSNPDSTAIVKEADTPVDDSYFSDAVFIGDSRMQGFQNASGITQGTFFTSVGMSLATMQSEAVIPTSEGNVTVAAALSGGHYGKVYIMLGTNDLGEYDWDSFKEGFISCVKRFQEIQPDAIFYICSVFYVEESKITSGSSYVTNANVDKINSILLDICESEGYHYLNLNEILSNGYGSLIEGASSDGVHVYEKYCKQMLTYLKSHYVIADDASDNSGKEEQETEPETEAKKEETK